MKTHSSEKDGILLLVDKDSEWLLSWWWLHYHFFHSFPLMFIDLGMSELAHKWCARRGEVHKLELPDHAIGKKETVTTDDVNRWSKIGGDPFWKMRETSFKKPFACLKSPFKRTITMDLTCQVQTPLDALFGYCDNPSGAALTPEPPAIQKLNIEHQLAHKDEVSYSSALIVFKHGSPLIHAWAEKTIHEHAKHPTEHHVLSKMIFEKKNALQNLPETALWPLFLGVNPRAVLFDYVGPKGTSSIQQQIKIMTENLYMDLSLDESVAL